MRGFRLSEWILYQTTPVSVYPDSVKHSNIMQEGSSSFQAHSAKITDPAQVMPAMHEIFTNHKVAKATHNVYAYIITSANTIVENSNDDGDFGAGKKLLRFLRESNICNKIVVITS